MHAFLRGGNSPPPRLSLFDLFVCLSVLCFVPPFSPSSHLDSSRSTPLTRSPISRGAPLDFAPNCKLHIFAPQLVKHIQVRDSNFSVLRRPGVTLETDVLGEEHHAPSVFDGVCRNGTSRRQKRAGIGNRLRDHMDRFQDMEISLLKVGSEGNTVRALSSLLKGRRAHWVPRSADARRVGLPDVRSEAVPGAQM